MSTKNFQDYLEKRLDRQEIAEIELLAEKEIAMLINCAFSALDPRIRKGDIA